jgi:hypothetical protein
VKCKVLASNLIPNKEFAKFVMKDIKLKTESVPKSILANHKKLVAAYGLMEFVLNAPKDGILIAKKFVPQ